MSGRQPSILLVSPYFPPRRRVGALRAWRFATQLHARGWRVSVVALAAPDEAWTEREARAISGVDIHWMTTPLDRTTSRRGALSGGAARPAAPEHRVNAAGGPGLGASVSQRIDQAFPVDTWLPLFLWRSSAARAFAQRVAPDVLWSTADPWSSHLLAALVHGATGGAEGPVPWIADFRDPWTLCAVRSRGRPGWTRALDRRAETWILERADAVTYTAEETHRRSTASWPHLAGKMHVLPNAYDSSAWSEAPLEGPLDGQPARGDGRLRVQFFGAFRPLSPARPLIAALAVLREIAPEALARIDICSTAPLAGEDCAAAVGAGVAEAFCAVAPQPYEAAMRTLRQADLLLISTEPGRDDIIPAKLWDYLPVGRPVLNLSPNPETAALVASTGVGVTLAPGDPLAIAALLRACVDAIDRGGPLPLRFSPNRERILAYDAGSVTSGLVSLAEGLMRSRRGLVEAL